MGTHKSEQLPERLRQLLSEAYLANERAYWQQREQLVQRFANKWVAVHNGQVVTVGEDMATVMDEVGKQGLCDAYIEKVGGETDTFFQSGNVLRLASPMIAPISRPSRV